MVRPEDEFWVATEPSDTFDIPYVEARSRNNIVAIVSGNEVYAPPAPPTPPILSPYGIDVGIVEHYVFIVHN